MKKWGNLESRAKNNNRSIDGQWIIENEINEGYIGVEKKNNWDYKEETEKLRKLIESVQFEETLDLNKEQETIEELKDLSEDIDEDLAWRRLQEIVDESKTKEDDIVQQEIEHLKRNLDTIFGTSIDDIKTR